MVNFIGEGRVSTQTTDGRVIEARLPYSTNDEEEIEALEALGIRKEVKKSGNAAKQRIPLRASKTSKPRNTSSSTDALNSGEGSGA